MLYTFMLSFNCDVFYLKKVESMRNILHKKKANRMAEINQENDINEDVLKNETSPVANSSLVLNERYILDKEDEDEEMLSNVLDQMQSFSIEWKSLRGVLQCSCGSPIDYLTRKVSF